MTVELEIDPDGFRVSFVVLASAVEGVTLLRISTNITDTVNSFKRILYFIISSFLFVTTIADT